ncbi:50S ribosomal protein L23 [Chitinophaga caeni]|uniref:Large ribosomal subunit protein uL23 n=1 Tax=Chitinophaga caeni TaxID=2029983 RepID=A0A291QTS2_9BACT|nr:50S ribosomal protein L23 [Chitinophaga caeni]ATL47429.1 50S ribosomal protein L23 [Chitinophaga caeni]
MNLSDVLIKPVVTEKVNKATEKFNRYYFIVDKKANKVEIKNAVKQFYGVEPVSVNTSVMPGKTKTRFTKAGFISGRKPSFKKAIVTLAEGDSIDLYANI